MTSLGVGQKPVAPFILSLIAGAIGIGEFTTRLDRDAERGEVSRCHHVEPRAVHLARRGIGAPDDVEAEAIGAAGRQTLVAVVTGSRRACRCIGGDRRRGSTSSRRGTTAGSGQGFRRV